MPRSHRLDVDLLIGARLAAAGWKTGQEQQQSASALGTGRSRGDPVRLRTCCEGCCWLFGSGAAPTISAALMSATPAVAVAGAAWCCQLASRDAANGSNAGPAWLSCLEWLVLGLMLTVGGGARGRRRRRPGDSHGPGTEGGLHFRRITRARRNPLRKPACTGEVAPLVLPNLPVEQVGRGHCRGPCCGLNSSCTPVLLPRPQGQQVDHLGGAAGRGGHRGGRGRLTRGEWGGGRWRQAKVSCSRREFIRARKTTGRGWGTFSRRRTCWGICLKDRRWPVRCELAVHVFVVDELLAGLHVRVLRGACLGRGHASLPIGIGPRIAHGLDELHLLRQPRV